MAASHAASGRRLNTDAHLQDLRRMLQAARTHIFAGQLQKAGF